MLGHEDVSHGDLELGGGCGAREPLDRGQVEGFPGVGLDPVLDAIHGHLEELVTETVFELLFEV